MSIKVAIIGSDQVIGDIREVLDEDKVVNILSVTPQLLLQHRGHVD